MILCECTTEECRDEGKDTCYAAHVCYSQYLRDTLTRGCIDDRSSLLCENQRPKGVDNWPSLYCCSDRNFCNKDVTPTLPTDPGQSAGPDSLLFPQTVDRPCFLFRAVKDPGHSAKRAGGRIRLNTHAPYPESGASNEVTP